MIDRLKRNRVQYCLLLLVAFLHSTGATGHYIEDSLRTVLAQPALPPGDRVMVLSNLGSMVFFTKSHDEGLQLLSEALLLSRTLPDGQYTAYTYGVMAGRYQIGNNLPRARACLDSAAYYAARTGSRRIKGFVAYMQGWMYNRTNQREKAVAAFLTALKTLDGQKAYTYESSIYEELALIYGEWEDAPSREKYIRLCYTASLHTGQPDYVIAGTYNLASFLEGKYRMDTLQKPLLDSALYYFKEALALTYRNQQRIIHRTDLPYISYCIGNIYDSYSPYKNQDSATAYFKIALKEGLNTGHYSVVALCYSVLGRYALEQKKYRLAEEMQLAVISALQKNPAPEHEIMADAYLALSEIQEQKGDPAAALRYYKEYVKRYKGIFDSRKMSEAKKLEAQYETEKKEQALKALQARVAYNKRLNTVYIILTLASMLLLLFVFYAYKQRTKALQQQQRLHALEVDKIKQEHQISLLSAILEGQEQERSRLARDLHDGLGGLLSGIKIQLSEMTPVLPDPKPQNLLQKILGHLDNAVDELRRIARSMMPEVLLKYGLGEATQEYCRSFRSPGLSVTCQVFHYTNRMAPERQTVLYRIMQELVNNAVKHAAATHLLVQLQESGEQIFLTVEDDGGGFDPELLRRVKGSGLSNIRARVAFLKGKMDIDSKPGTGTTILIESPI
ncbi:tetratricopeptide repeat-containing sensor histidine kinase [Taibaiella chishuiensis]|nr:sensor histidine kinase [Taibaiella chishuiensis]